LERLQADLRLASRVLYDLTNGQAALGDITLYHAKEHWQDADIRIYATNQLRPHATIGGIVDGLVLETITRTVSNTITTNMLLYAPGQVAMGAVWNRYGEAGASIGEDWARTLAHELGHYLFYLQDNYIGLDGQHIVAVDGCPGMMSNPYFEPESEFHPEHGWLPQCTQTFAHQVWGRWDWAILTQFYPWLHAPPSGIPIDHPAMAGPNALILAVTQVRSAPPITPVATLVEPTFFLAKADSSHYTPSAMARAFLFQEQQILDLGALQTDQALARGAQSGDELCVFDLAAKPEPLVGCKLITQSGEQIVLAPQANWQPDVVITPVTSRTIAISVTGVTADALVVRAYPEDAPMTVTATLRASSAGDLFTGRLTLPEPTQAAYLYLYDPDNRQRRMVINYVLGSGASSLILRNGDTLQMSSGSSVELSDGSTLELNDGDMLAMTSAGLTLRLSHGNTIVLDNGATLRLSHGNTLRLSHGNTLRLSHGNTRVLRNGSAPIVSSDGQVTLFGDEVDIEPGEFYILQPATTLPNPPLWSTIIGQAYRLTASPGARDLKGASLTINYLGREISADKEQLLRVYFWDGEEWQTLPTVLDTEHNIAYAAAQGLGLYVLMYSIDLPLEGPGWNPLRYPLQESRPLTVALSSINGLYNTVYGYKATEADRWQRWQVYAAAPAPIWTNTLHELAFGPLYWINITATHSITIKFPDRGVNTVTGAEANLLLPPATYYGEIVPTAGFTPTIGLPLRAWIGANLCGEAVTRAEAGQIVYAVTIYAAGAPEAPNCGAPGQTIYFTIAGQAMLPQPAWDNSQVWELPLTFAPLGSVTGSSFTFASLSDKTLGDPPFQINATSALPASFASLTPAVCIVSGNTITLLATGICTIYAAQTDDSPGSLVPAVQQSFTVLPSARVRNLFLPLIAR